MTRILYLDLVKFFAIYLVVFAHTVTYGIVNDSITCSIHNIIYAFHMPLFAIVSGYFFKADFHWSSFLLKKFITLIYPIVFFAFIYSVFILRLPNDIPSLSFHAQAYLRDFLIAVRDMGWFLKAIFLCYVYLNLANYVYSKNAIAATFLSVFILYVTTLLGIIPNKCDCVEDFVFLYPFFVTGSLFRQYNFLDRGHKILYILSLLVFVFCYIFLWKHSYCFYSTNTSFFAQSSDNVFGITLVIVMFFRYLMGLIGSYFVIMTFKKLCDTKCADNNQHFTYINLLATVGQCSLGIYLIQDIVLPLLKGCVSVSSSFLSFTIAVFMAFVICLAITMFVQLTKRYHILSVLMWGKK